MRGMTTRSRAGKERGLRVSVAVALLVVLGACSGGEPDVDPELVSGQQEAFEIVEHDDARYVVGHGVALEMGPGWTDYQPEQEGTDGTTYEWAVGLPVEDGTFPSGLQFSMGKPGVGAQMDTLPDAVREVAELSEGYQFVDEGEAEVPGAEQAAFLRFVRDFEYEGEEIRVEQVTLMIEVADGHTSSIRFLAPEGEWEEQMQEVYDSIVVTVGEAA